MPFARTRLYMFIGGVLLASSSLSPVSAQPANATAASPFTGTYVGTTQLVEDNDPGCAQGSAVSFAVEDGNFRFPWHEPQAFHAKIAADGSFYATSGSKLAQSDKHMMIVPIMRGHVNGTSLVAEYGTRWCRYRLEVIRS